MTSSERIRLSCWVLILVFSVLTLAVALNVQLTMELADKIDALPEQTVFKPSLPCGAIPTRFVLDEPVCAQKLIESMNVTNVRILSREAAKAEMERQDEVLRSLTSHDNQWP
jgi:hypothetical protein